MGVLGACILVFLCLPMFGDNMAGDPAAGVSSSEVSAAPPEGAEAAADVSSDEARRHYGLSFNDRCGEYSRVFKCMTACKSSGFQVFRMDRKCRCSCHEMKTTTVLPFFKWRTNGTTATVPRTFSVQLYHIAGTLSPATQSSTTENATTPVTCPTLPTSGSTNTTTTANVTGNATSSDTDNATTPAGNDTEQLDNTNGTDTTNDTTTTTTTTTTQPPDGQN